MDDWSQVTELTEDEVNARNQLNEIEKEPQNIKDHVSNGKNDSNEELLEDLMVNEAIEKVFHPTNITKDESLKMYKDQQKWLDTKVEKYELCKNGMPYPECCSMIGINDQFAVAFKCPHAQTIEKPRPKEEAPEGEEEEKEKETSIVIDAIGTIEKIYNKQEAAMFQCSEMQSAHRLKDQTQCQQRVRELVLLASNDKTIHDACNAAVKEVAERRQHVPQKLPKPQTAEEVKEMATEYTFNRPGDTMSSHSCNRFEMAPLPNDEVVLPNGQYDRMGMVHVLVCPVPQIGENKKKSKKVKTWTSIGIDIPMPRGQVPAGSFNAKSNHLLVVYQRADIDPSSPYRYYCYADVYEIKQTQNGSRKTPVPIHQMCFALPDNIPLNGLLDCHLSDGDIISVTLGSFCIIVDPNVDDSARIITISHPSSDYAQSGMVSRACVFHYEDDPESSFLVIGTKHGEAYHMNWITGERLGVFITPNVEAIYRFHYASNKLLMQCIASVQVVPLVKPEDSDGESRNLASLFAPLSLPMVRPVASFLYGSQIACFGKYEQLFLCSTIARRITRVWDSIPGKESRCGHNQISYDGLYATINSIYILQMDGFIRKVYWPDESDLEKALEKTSPSN